MQEFLVLVHEKEEIWPNDFIERRQHIEAIRLYFDELKDQQCLIYVRNMSGVSKRLISGLDAHPLILSDRTPYSSSYAIKALNWDAALALLQKDPRAAAPLGLWEITVYELNTVEGVKISDDRNHPPPTEAS